METDIFKAKVHFVAGKGGVGKTLIAQALAMHFAERFNTLLVELGEEEEGVSSLRLSSIKEVSKNLSHVKVFPDQALYEYLRLKVPKALLNTLLSQSLFRALGSAMPGLSDLTRMGKIWYHRDDYQRIVVDMPSSGFVSRFLNIASVVNDAVKIGPLAKEAKLIHEYMIKNAKVHLVALPKELVVNETIELHDELKREVKVEMGHLFINRVLDLTFFELPSDLNFYPEASLVIETFKKRKREEDEEILRLAKGVKLSPITFFDQIGEMMDSKIVSSMVKALAKVSP